MTSKNILMIENTFHGVGGHDTVITNLCIELQKLGYNPAIGAFHFIQTVDITVDGSGGITGVELSSSANDTSASGGGIILRSGAAGTGGNPGTNDKSITWTNDRWTSSEDMNVANGKGYLVNGVSVIDSSKNWQGNTIAITKLPTGISSNNVLECDATVADDDFLRINGTKVEGRSATEVKSDLGLTKGIVNGNVLECNQLVSHDDFLRINGTKVEGRSATEVKSDLGLTEGIANGNVLECDATVADDDFLRINGTKVEGRSATEVKSDLGLTKGIVNGNVLECDANIADDDFLRIKGTKVEGRSATEVKSDLGLTKGIVNGNVLECDANIADDDFLRIKGTKVEGRSATEVKSDLGLTKGIVNGNVLECDANIADDDFLRIKGTKVEGRSTAELKTDLSLNNVTNESKATMFTSPAFTGTATGANLTLTGNLNVQGTYTATNTTTSDLQVADNSVRLSYVAAAQTATPIGENSSIQFGHDNSVAKDARAEILYDHGNGVAANAKFIFKIGANVVAEFAAA